MAEVSVRPAKEGDWKVIAGFNKAMALETEGKELSEEVVAEGTKELFNNPGYGFYVVAEVGGEIVDAAYRLKTVLCLSHDLKRRISTQ